MNTQTNTDLKELNQLHQSMCNSVFEHVWFPVEILCPNMKFDDKKYFSMEEQIDCYFYDHDDYCGVREIGGKYQVNFPIYRLDYMVGLDVVLEHMIFDNF
jgi:hypothetical protein